MTNTAGKRLIKFNDTTARDGEQAPGISFSVEDKVALAHKLSRMGFDGMEVSFPASSPQAFEACKRVAMEVGHSMEGREHIGRPMVISALCRTLDSDIELAYEALKYAKHFRFDLFIATSDLHLEHKLGISREECLNRLRMGIRKARSYTPIVGFGAEDSSRTDLDFLVEVYSMAIEEGCHVLFFADTVGACTPEQIYDIMKHLIDNTPYDPETIWGIHAHNDLGLAVANTLAAIRAGATYVDGTMVGIGERTGNAPTEEVAMCLTMHGDHYNVYHQLDISMITEVCELVIESSGFQMAWNKPLIGRNAFRHTSGVHQRGLLKNRATYEFVHPEDIGRTSDFLILSKHSGRRALQMRLEQLGFRDLSEEQLQVLFQAFKTVADTKIEVSDQDLKQLMCDRPKPAESLVAST
ncbi:2-isopropylmalate synthase (Alpha-isopropylmalate synthase) (Alpha-IPM synthetase) [Dimargaris verticillata]|uniref:2-isopropylmalate synthase n=1 Tax=Dimargaris verticillata TaxID=2761393 RepID=A0A9W8EB77_9FUNG|nr:2-isopropylmalate synthase (Alpha-isopropylmalate synthase) (Alpha-IPM synthetase) [Dimargaris verticillata]